jgi:hypothetical protein
MIHHWLAWWICVRSAHPELAQMAWMLRSLSAVDDLFNPLAYTQDEKHWCIWKKICLCGDVILITSRLRCDHRRQWGFCHV